jgi:hypothetical protein
MADETKTGSDWSEDELDVIVKDYFDMLGADLARQSYSKSKHNAALEAQIARSHGSIEFKHQNISAVLEKLGLPWIPGYKPRRHYHGAILDAIDRYLSNNPQALEIVPAAQTLTRDASEVFVDTPELIRDEVAPEPLRRLLTKFDPVERDHLNRSLGKAGEAFVLDIERKRLYEAAREDLAGRVRWVAAEDGDGAGYDILSFDPHGGRERLIEVKTTNGAARTPFFVSRNERAMAIKRPSDWRIYRVHLFAKEARIFTIAPPLESAVKLTTETWRASF